MNLLLLNTKNASADTLIDVKRSSVILLVLLVLLPLGLLGWAGVRLAAQEQQRLKTNIEKLLQGQLAEVDRSIQSQFATLAEEMQRVTAIDQYQASELREVARNDPRIFQLFVIDPEDVLVYPSPIGPLTRIEREFLLKASDLVNDRKLQLSQSAATQNLNEQDSTLLNSTSKRRSHGQPPTSGQWHVWYWGPGMHLIYWQRRTSGHIVGVALERSRWVADLIAELPDTPVQLNSEAATASRTQIIESGNEVIYKWGAYDPGSEANPVAELRLSAPLAAWQLQTFVPMTLLSAGKSGTMNMFAGLIVSGVSLMALAIAIGRQHGNEMREATRKVSFVNQVSHELRTPLTNIRMYAELLDQDLDSFEDQAQVPRRHLQVILNESQRLSRLIGNVLTFARQEKQTLRLNPQPVVVNDIIQNVVNSFLPTLEQKEIEVELDLAANEPVLVDADVLEQILVNLISNVEKYAANGNWMKISSRISAGIVSVCVADHGPGIEAHHCSQVFLPFWRASNDLNQSAGTGIGLTIVQYLARLHGGNALLLPTSRGAEFEVRLKISKEQRGNG